MKKIYALLFSTAGIILGAHAQPFEKGQKLLGGGIGIFHSTKPVFSTNTSSYLNVSPSYGVFTKPNRLTGVSIQLGSNLNAQHSVGINLYKQYWSTLGKNIYFIMQGQVGVGYSTEKSGDRFDPNNVARQNQNYTFSANVSPGFAYRINRRLIVDAFLANFIAVGYTHATSTSTYANGTKAKLTTNTINLFSNLNANNLSNIGIGFRYIL